MDQKTMIEIASIRLALIQPAFNGTYPDATKKQYYERISEVPLKLPDGKAIKYSAGTLACWESDYRKGGFEALMPRQRSDSGKSRKLDDVSLSTIQRYIKKHNLKGASAPGQKDRKAFEEEYVGGMYQGDTMYGPYLTENGVRRRTYCIMLLDDKSRMIVAGRFFMRTMPTIFRKS